MQVAYSLRELCRRCIAVQQLPSTIVLALVGTSQVSAGYVPTHHGSEAGNTGDTCRWYAASSR